MATTLEQLQQFLDDSALKYHAHEEMQLIAIGFAAAPHETTYRRPGTDDPGVQMILKLLEDGELLLVLAPCAYDLTDCPHQQAVCEAVARVQSRMKLLRFDLVDGDGGTFLQPNVEIPLEDMPLSAEQMHRAIAAVLVAIREFDPVVRHAMENGVVDFSLVTANVERPPAEVEEILNLGEAAGGLDAIERLLGGDGAHDDEDAGDDADDGGSDASAA
jgi:hypothetical protein